MKRLIPSTHVLQSFIRKGLPAADALAELIDNAHDAGASKVTIIFEPKSVRVVDNGRGVANLDDLFGLGHSRSMDVADAIGQFGIGAKDAQLHFGTRVTVRSVHKGRYYKRTLDWAKTIESGEWPEAFDGQSAPAEDAPKALQAGGTMIEIQDLVPRPRFVLNILARKLAQRYLPGLRKGFSIHLIDLRSGKAHVKLSPDLVTSSLNIGEIVAGEAAGKAFNVMFTTLKPAHDPDAPGVHVGFGGRFIVRLRRLGETWLPHKLYAEVMLSSAWKTSLSPNKTKIVSHMAELETAVLAILRPLIAKLEHEVEQAHIDHVNLALAKDFASVIVFEQRKEGSKAADDQTVRTTSGRRGHGPVKPNPNRKSNPPKDGGEQGESKRKRRPTGISFSRNDQLSPYLASDHDLKDGMLVIYLNGTIPAIALAYEAAHKQLALWPIIAQEFANFCVEHIDDLDRLLPGFLDALNSRGWDLSPEYPEELRMGVYTFILRQMPLTKDDRKKVAKLSEVRADKTSRA